MKLKSILLWCFTGILIGIAITTTINFMTYELLEVSIFGLGCVVIGMIIVLSIIKIEQKQ